MWYFLPAESVGDRLSLVSTKISFTLSYCLCASSDIIGQVETGTAQTSAAVGIVWHLLTTPSLSHTHVYTDS